MLAVLGKILGSGDVIKKGMELIMGMTLAGQGDVDAVKQILGDFWIGEIVLVIVSFYFGGGLVESARSKK
jgi:hypothetical protein